MTKLKRLYRLLSTLSGGRWVILAISAVLPVLIIMGFGFVLALQYGYLLELSLAVTISTLAVIVPLYFLSLESKNTENEAVGAINADIDDGLVKASSDWSQAELVIWNEAKAYSREQVESGIEWGGLNKAGLEVLDLVAQRFGKKTLDFSVPEGLKLFEEVSRRYKLVVKENIPGIEYLTISHIKAGYAAYDKYGAVGQKVIKAAIWANHVKNLYFNPLKVAVDLTKQQVTSSMTKGFVEDIQIKSKQALLDEVAAVAMDLYSGRFSLEDDDLVISNASETDSNNLAQDLEPIRIVIVGQTGAGKSSIVNVLKSELAAEVDILPSTQTATVYGAVIKDIAVRLVDLRGLEGESLTEKHMLKEMTQADLVLWVLKANQSARDLDKQLHDQLSAYYADPKQVSSKKPTVISVVNQVDKLKPLAEWQPPYDLESPVTAKGKIIAEALSYNHQLLQPDLILPLSIADNKAHFGVERLKQTLLDCIEDANNVQRNRQRIEAMQRGVPLKDQIGRAVNITKKVSGKSSR